MHRRSLEARLGGRWRRQGYTRRRFLGRPGGRQWWDRLDNRRASLVLIRRDCQEGESKNQEDNELLEASIRTEKTMMSIRCSEP